MRAAVGITCRELAAETVFGAQAVEERLQRIRQPRIGGGQIGPLGVAAALGAISARGRDAAGGLIK